MPNDAKLGLVAGVAIVVLIAALFFRKDSQADASLPGALPQNQHSPTIPGMTRPPADNDLPPLPPPALPDVPMAGAG